MAEARPSPLVFYVLIVATFGLAAAVIWFTLTLAVLPIVVAVPVAAIVAFTGKKVCE